jgi:predicted  nucleic acid-binding Zn-ribbon protein
MEEFKAAVAEEENKLDLMRQDLANEESSSVERVAELDRKLGNLATSHKDYEANIPVEILRRYKRIQKAWLGMAVVPVDAKGSCDGCHRRLPPQLYNTLLRNDALHTCPYCNRFIYVEITEPVEV